MVKVVRIGIILSTILSLVSSTTWIYTAPRALLDLAGSASASASAPPTPASSIADLRKKSAKLSELQAEKNGIGLEQEEHDNSEEQSNEASPSLFQKKIGKILTKLRLIAQIKNAYHYKPEDHVHDTNLTFTVVSRNKTDEPIKNAENNEVDSDYNVTVGAKIESQSSNIQQIPSKISITFPKLVDRAKTDLSANKIDDKLENIDTNIGKEEPNRLGAIGVFFIELIGSLVGLTYGAVAQIAAGGQSPVTASTSEGL